MAPIVAQAKVVRVHEDEADARKRDEPGMGVVFTAMSEESYTALAGFWRAMRYGVGLPRF